MNVQEINSFNNKMVKNKADIMMRLHAELIAELMVIFIMINGLSIILFYMFYKYQILINLISIIAFYIFGTIWNYYHYKNKFKEIGY